MDKNSTLLTDEDPMLAHIDHADTTCLVGWTNFHVCLNPAGMALIKEIDPTSRIYERYSHMAFIKGAMHHASVVQDDLYTVEGFAKLWAYMNTDARDGEYIYGRVHQLLADGLLHNVDVKEDSPLVGWFNVMKGVSNG